MLYLDPLESYQFDQDVQRVYNPGESLLNRTVFDSYAQPTRKLSVYVVPTQVKSMGLGRKLLRMARPEPGRRLPSGTEASLSAEPGKAIASRMLENGSRLRALEFRGRDVEIAVYEVSGDPADGPDLK